MSFPSFQHVTPPLRRSVLPRLLAIAVTLAIGACDQDDSPFDPSDTPAAPTDEALSSAEHPTLEPALAITGQRIVFSSNRKDGYDLYKMNPQGDNVVRLTNFADWADEPAWSWDNKRIAMVRGRRDAANVEHQDIFLMNADGTNKRWARSVPSSFPIRYPSWHPDGSRLVVNVIIGGAYYVATLKLSTGEMAFVMAGGQVVQGTEPSYDKTGTKIMYVSVSGTTIDLVSSGGNIRLVSASTTLSSPSFSPDGKKIAYSKTVSGNTDVYVTTLATNATKRLTTHTGSDTQPTWSPDGTKIAFESTRSGTRQIWTMNASTGGSLTRITHTSKDESDPKWSH